MKCYVVTCEHIDLDFGDSTQVVAVFHSKQSAEGYVSRKQKKITEIQKKLTECNLCLKHAINYIDSQICEGKYPDRSTVLDKLPDICPLTNEAPNLEIFGDKEIDGEYLAIYDVGCKRCGRMEDEIYGEPSFVITECDLWQ